MLMNDAFPKFQAVNYGTKIRLDPKEEKANWNIILDYRSYFYINNEK